VIVFAELGWYPGDLSGFDFLDAGMQITPYQGILTTRTLTGDVAQLAAAVRLQRATYEGSSPFISTNRNGVTTAAT
jgi:hypothetical protein